MSDVPSNCRVAALVAYGKPLEIVDAQVPQRLEPGSVLVRTLSSTVCATDVHAWEGGIGSREALFSGYEAEAGHAIDRSAVPYWEVMGTVRWAVIALQQAARHYVGHETSLELALTAHVLPVLELDLLTRIQQIEETGR